MHRTRGRVARPHRHQRTSPAKTPRAARVGVHGYDVLAAEFGVRVSSSTRGGASERMASSVAAASITESSTTPDAKSMHTTSSVATSKDRRSPRIAKKSTTPVCLLGVGGYVRGGSYTATLSQLTKTQAFESPTQTFDESQPTQTFDESQPTQTFDDSQPLLSPENDNDNDSFNGENNNDIDDHDHSDDAIVFDSGIGDDGNIDDFAITEFTSDDFEVNERCRYYMDNILITSENRAAVEFVYMVEADTIVRSQNTLRKPELAAKLLEKYKQLISLVPSGRFGECGLQAVMCHKYFKAKKSSASGLQEKVKLVKPQVQALCRTLNLTKLPSGRGINDVKMEYIIQKYRETMGEVSYVACCLLDTYFFNTQY